MMNVAILGDMDQWSAAEVLGKEAVGTSFLPQSDDARIGLSGSFRGGYGGG